MVWDHQSGSSVFLLMHSFLLYLRSTIIQSCLQGCLKLVDSPCINKSLELTTQASQVLLTVKTLTGNFVHEIIRSFIQQVFLQSVAPIHLDKHGSIYAQLRKRNSFP